MKMEEWKECKLKDICDYGKDRIEVSSLDNTTYISTENMLPNRAGITIATTLPTGEYTPSFELNDTLVSNIRPYFKKIWKATFSGGCSADVLVFKAKENISKDYLYYVLADDEFFKYSMATSKGTKMPRGDKTSIMNYPVKLPPLPTQQKIAAILSSLDDKIELNNKINTNLEQQAGAIFKNWFVDFEPFGGKMPDGWKVGVISDFGNVICGKTPSTKIKDYYGDEIPFITIPDMHNSVYACYTERYLSVKGAQSQESKNLPPNSICVSCIATPGLVVLTDRISQTNQQINSIVPNENISPYYIYLTLKNLSETIKMLGSSGSTTSNLNKEQFSKIQIMIPNDKVMKKFESFVQPMFEKIRSLQKENSKLVTIRDTLLPKLMNGEIELDEVSK